MSAATYPLSPFGRAGGSYLAPDLTIRGRIETSGSVEMDCEFHGDVLARQAYVGPNGRIRARISAEEATVSGEMTGIVTARQAFFRDGCHFRGEVEYESLGTEPNAGVDARLVPVLTGSSSIAIPSVRDIPAQAAALPSSPAPASASAPPRINLSMLAFLGGMIVAGVITGILVVNPTTRSWKDQLLEQVLQPRPDAIPPAPMAAAPAATPVVSEEPRITPPPPPAIPPSLSKMLPTPAPQDQAPKATETLETRSAAAPAPAQPAPVSTPAAPAAPDLSATPALPRHETVAPSSPAPVPAPVVTAAPADVPPAPAPTAQTAPTPASAPVVEPPAPLPVVASPAPVSPAPVIPAPPPAAVQAPAALPAVAPVAPSTPAPSASSEAPAKAAVSAEPAKPLIAVDAAKDAKAATALPASPAQSPVPAAAKKPKSPPLPAGARGALQEVCSWELKCDSDNQCVSVRSCKMQ